MPQRDDQDKVNDLLDKARRNNLKIPSNSVIWKEINKIRNSDGTKADIKNFLVKKGVPRSVAVNIANICIVKQSNAPSEGDHGYGKKKKRRR